LRIGPPGAFDSEQLYPSSSDLITLNGKHWIYYTGGQIKHEMPPLADSDEPHSYAIGLAEIREDGFFHLKMTGMGLLETKSFIWEGDWLEINCDSTKGQLWVEVLDGQGQPIPGFTAAEADVNACNGAHHVVSWRGSENAGALKRQEVRLRFLYAGEVDLYAFQVLAGED